MIKKALDWLDDRSGYRSVMRHALDEPLPGGASIAYVFGSVLVFILLLQMVTGVFLAMYYSPSATDAWASVAYIQDQVTAGWFIRGLHHHGASAMVVVAGLHMLQTAIYGAYKKPRELNWIIGVLMLGLILAFALTGYLLPWDQTGYWATKVATGIAGTTPVVGEPLQHAIQGGNEYGNLTLTRFFSIHVFILPGALILLTVVHVALFRRHGHTPHWKLDKKQLEARTQLFWPHQMFRDMVAMAACFAVIVGLSVGTHGAGLDAPADPASGFDARPEWYFRPLFQLLKYFEGPMETVVALGLPVIAGGVLLGLPFADRGPDRSPKRRAAYLAVLLAGFAIAAILTAASFLEDAGNESLQERIADSEERGQTARELALEHGVPAAGGYAVFEAAEGEEGKGGPNAEATAIWQADCAGCHQGDELSGPELGPGYNSRAWIRAFLKNPSGPRFFGETAIDKMEPVALEGRDFDAIVELVYAETGAAAADADLVVRGRELFDDGGDCSLCHEIDGTSESSAPNLGGRGTEKMLAEFIGRPSHPKWFGKLNEMPDFYDKYNRAQRDKLAALIKSWQSADWPPGDDR
jgi:ubiquinol-cytochrome c reductase cytochrome b subunit